MPDWMWMLPCITLLTASSLFSVAGCMALEVFCGCGVMSLCFEFAQVPLFRRWDSKFGERFDVITEGWKIQRLICLHILVLIHFGKPCSSPTFARRVELRNWQWPMGVPGLTGRDRQILEQGNELVAWTVQTAELLLLHSWYFSIENPFPGWFWIIPMVKGLWWRSGVILTILSQSTYDTAWGPQGGCTASQGAPGWGS